MALSIVGALALLLLSACGGDGDSTPNPHPDVPEGAPQVDQDNLRFIPTSLTVEPGTLVYFTNSETALHTVDIDGEDVSGDMRKGDLFTFTFEEEGEFKITCKYHAQMKATITVGAAQ